MLAPAPRALKPIFRAILLLALPHNLLQQKAMAVPAERLAGSIFVDATIWRDIAHRKLVFALKILGLAVKNACRQ